MRAKIFWFHVLAGIFMLSQLVQAGDDLQSQILSARDRVMPALVHIEPVVSFYTTGEKRHTLVTGSGFIFSPEGYVLTNNHVVENAEKVTCTLSNKRKLSARVVGTDPSTDIAVLQLDLSDWGNTPLPYAPLGNSDSLQVGQIVLALGSPLGLSRSLSMGVVSSIDRYFKDQGDMISPYNLWIQTDAAINPGNSGGPLIDLRGRVIGINARGVMLAENLGFAIPINLAREIARKLLQEKKIQRSWLGLVLQPIKDFREYLGLPHLQGALIASVDPFSPASRSNIQPGDVLVSINEQPVHAEYTEDLPAVRKIISDLPIGQTVKLTIWRKGKTHTVRLKTQPEPFVRQPEFECPEVGMVVKNLTRHIFEMQKLPDYHGVFVSGVKRGELAYQSGVRIGDVIRTINGQAVTSLSSFKKLYRKAVEQPESIIFLKIYRASGEYYVAIQRKSL